MKALARRRARRWLDGWEEVAGALPQWQPLDRLERDRAAELVEHFAGTWTWEAARGFALSQEAVVTVAASAAVLGLGLDVDAWRGVRAVVLHPGPFGQHGPRAAGVGGLVTSAPRRLHGHAQDRTGPIALSWPAVRRDVHHPARGQHVVVHELAHKLDAADGTFDGAPALPPPQRAELHRLCRREQRRMLRRTAPDPVLRRYGAESPAELFAVASEAFVQRPVDLEEHHAALYDALRRCYGQDPAARIRRTSSWTSS